MVAADAGVPPIARLLDLLQSEKIRFLIAGMSAAVLQGVPYTTLDTYIWIDLPSRQYIRVIKLCRSLSAEVTANTVVILTDGNFINFLYRVDGLRSFVSEYRQANQFRWLGQMVRVLPVDRLYASKKSVGRPKDIAHLPILEKYLACERAVHSKPGGGSRRGKQS